jgi:hypothetical protein
VVHCSGVDHPDPQVAGATGTCTGGPVGQIAGTREHVEGVLEHGRGARGEHAAPTIAFEQRDADPAFEFCEPLRQRRRRDPESTRGVGPGRGLDDCDQVVELLHREVRQVTRHGRRLVQND